MIVKTLKALVSSKNYIEDLIYAGRTSFDDLQENEKDILIGLLNNETDKTSRDEFLTNSKDNEKFTHLYSNILLAANADAYIKHKLENKLLALMRDMSHEYFKNHINELLADALEKRIIEEKNLPANYFIPNFYPHSLV